MRERGNEGVRERGNEGGSERERARTSANEHTSNGLEIGNCHQRAAPTGRQSWQHQPVAPVSPVGPVGPRRPV